MSRPANLSFVFDNLPTKVAEKLTERLPPLPDLPTDLPDFGGGAENAELPSQTQLPEQAKVPDWLLDL